RPPAGPRPHLRWANAPPHRRAAGAPRPATGHPAAAWPVPGSTGCATNRRPAPPPTRPPPGQLPPPRTTSADAFHTPRQARDRLGFRRGRPVAPSPPRGGPPPADAGRRPPLHPRPATTT